MTWKLPEDWHALLTEELEQPYMQELWSWLDQEYKSEIVYPDEEQIFEPFRRTPYAKARVIILGQDPYHGEQQAHGLSFSVQHGVRIPPSLRNIYKELQADTGATIPPHGNLSRWADQGVLLLNTVLTVRAGAAYSHQRHGWERFTDAVLRKLNERNQPLVFILWGNHAQQKLPYLDQQKHCIITSSHPSPLSARHGFFGSRPFTRANQFLLAQGIEPVDWAIE